MNVDVDFDFGLEALKWGQVAVVVSAHAHGRRRTAARREAYDEEAVANALARDFELHGAPLRVPRDPDHRFHRKPITDSTGSRSPIPRQADQ